jgi:hypothetical protein
MCAPDLCSTAIQRSFRQQQSSKIFIDNVKFASERASLINDHEFTIYFLFGPKLQNTW